MKLMNSIEIQLVSGGESFMRAAVPVVASIWLDAALGGGKLPLPCPPPPFLDIENSDLFDLIEMVLNKLWGKE